MGGLRILIVEDDASLRSVLVRGLRDDGFAVAATASGGEFLDRADASPADAMIIDIGLPDADGRDVCQALRARGDQTPVLFLTARDQLVDRLGGFSAGGDDYLTKPFEIEEVVARIRALTRRAAPRTQEPGALRLDPAAHAVVCGSERLRVTPTEFRVLAALVARPGEAVRRIELIRAGWPHGAIVQENTLDAYIARLRRKLGSLDGAPRIDTVHGVGYSLQ